MVEETLKKQALELTQAERAQFAHFLIESLDPDTDCKSNESWDKELKNRVRQYKKGESLTKSWHKVKRNAQGLLNR
jgi:putative addiction module component (TIGR02574 family)